MGVGDVVFDINEKYDDEYLDDRELMRDYERAYEASRELMRRKKEGKKKKRTWKLGDACRAYYADLGYEYEGVIVNINSASRMAVVRLHGYAEEIDVKISDLEPSMGQNAVLEQIGEAAESLEAESEENLDPKEFKVDEYCRARWSADNVVYEAVITALDTKNKQVTVTFVGYENKDTVDYDSVFVSKGEEWREFQRVDAKPAEEVNEKVELDLGATLTADSDVVTKLLDDKYLKDLPDISNLLLNNEDPGNSTGADQVSNAANNYDGKSRLYGHGGKMNNHSSADAEPQSAPAVKVEKKSSNKTVRSRKKEPRSSKTSTTTTLAPPPLMPFKVPDLSVPMLPMPPPPPMSEDDLNFISNNHEGLQAMLSSWYMAGYHTGYYQGLKQGTKSIRKSS